MTINRKVAKTYYVNRNSQEIENRFNDLTKITESSMERMIKKHKKTVNKKTDCRKERKIRFFFMQ